MLTIRDFQTQHAAWVKKNFPGQGATLSALGMIEEIGELSHAVLKSSQNIRGSQEKHLADTRDALADIMVFFSHLCTSCNYEITEVLKCSSFDSLVPHVVAGSYYKPPLPRAVVDKLAGVRATGQALREGQWVLVLRITKHMGRISRCLEQENKLHKRAARKLFLCIGEICSLHRWSYEAIMEETWAKVSKRDWTKDRITGGEPS